MRLKAPSVANFPPNIISEKLRLSLPCRVTPWCASPRGGALVLAAASLLQRLLNKAAAQALEMCECLSRSGRTFRLGNDWVISGASPFVVSERGVSEGLDYRRGSLADNGWL